ncbi:MULTISPECIES: DUF1329 domain-containing protein [Idiomarina]|uniref:DUF1329 domain-containing protein n=1 Tax=Idiomarina TaxID=135575 RepID=UPI00129AA14B|nr:MULTISPECIES: DUF1329 domain-containing protein [Idiomarina]MRJ40707.1 DUF1329 domain-containing protein [Idiomarina sp. FeN1]NCU56511.1 DUF1329 domain-containing protein [Idiomarina sp. FenA--70]NCU58891.1 DUF1329 domain-containing protein [Idiomarina sp. FenBw--71]UUN14604.1 DUF1329 domain-containing protein [Idiomarina loihiensis]
MNKMMLKAGIFALSVVSASVMAKVSPDEANRLGQDLTPVGAEMAANADGSIPAWTGGYSVKADGEVPDRPADPFADEQPILTITPANVDQHANMLSPGQVAMFKKYPDFKIHVYPTHRTAAYPQAVYDVIKKNALNAELISGGNGLANFEKHIPFPIPSSGVEAVWNHITRYRGGSVQRLVNQFPVLENGSFVPVLLRESLVVPEYLASGRESADDNVLFYFLQEVLAPARMTGTVLLLHETIDQVKEARRAWLYNAGQRRVRKAPSVAYDGPGTASDGLRTSDGLDMFNGAPDKYNWELVGKREMYIPYNNYKLMDTSLSYDDIIGPGHMNQDYVRYEKHRVWEVKGTLKDGERHIYATRHMFIDEDTWTASVIDQYDGRGELWRVAEAYNTQFYYHDTPWMAAEALYDLNSGRYILLGLSNEESEFMNFGIKMSRSDFSTGSLRRMGIR